MERGMVIKITGDTLPGKTGDIFERRVNAAVIAIAPEAVYETYRFAWLGYRYKWTAKEFDIARVDTMHGRILRSCVEFLEKWMYSIKIDYTESGG